MAADLEDVVAALNALTAAVDRLTATTGEGLREVAHEVDQGTTFVAEAAR